MEFEEVMRMPKDAQARFCLAAAHLCEFLLKLQVSKGAVRTKALAATQNWIKNFVNQLGHDIELDMPSKEKKKMRAKSIEELDELILQGSSIVLTIVMLNCGATSNQIKQFWED